MLSRMTDTETPLGSTPGRERPGRLTNTPGPRLPIPIPLVAVPYMMAALVIALLIDSPWVAVAVPLVGYLAAVLQINGRTLHERLVAAARAAAGRPAKQRPEPDPQDGHRLL